MKYTQGFIALSSVLILSAIFLSISISIASRAISGSDTSIALHEKEHARFQAESCIGYALLELQRTLNYQGDEGILIHGGSCTIHAIGGDGNENRTVQAESTVGSHTYRIEAVVGEISPELTIASWERVESF